MLGTGKKLKGSNFIFNQIMEKYQYCSKQGYWSRQNTLQVNALFNWLISFFCVFQQMQSGQQGIEGSLAEPDHNPLHGKWEMVSGSASGPAE